MVAKASKVEPLDKRGGALDVLESDNSDFEEETDNEILTPEVSAIMLGRRMSQHSCPFSTRSSH